MNKILAIAIALSFMLVNVAYATGNHNNHDQNKGGGNTTNNIGVGVGVDVNSMNSNKNIVNSTNKLTNQNYNTVNSGSSATAITGPQNQDQTQQQTQSTILDNVGNNTNAVTNSQTLDNVGNNSNTVTNSVNFENGDTSSVSGSEANNNMEFQDNSQVNLSINNPRQFPVLEHNPATIMPAPLGDQVYLTPTKGIDLFAKLEQKLYTTYTADGSEMIGPLEFLHGLEVTINPFQKEFFDENEVIIIDNAGCENYDRTHGDPWDDCWDTKKQISISTKNATNVQIVPFVPKDTHNFVLVASMTTKCSECTSFIEMRKKSLRALKQSIPQKYSTLYELYLPSQHVAVNGSMYDGTNFGGTASGSWIANSLTALALSGTVGGGKTMPFLSEQGVTTYYFAIDDVNGVPLDLEVVLNGKSVAKPQQVQQKLQVQTPQPVEPKQSLVSKAKAQEAVFVPKKSKQTFDVIAYPVGGADCDKCKGGNAEK